MNQSSFHIIHLRPSILQPRADIQHILPRIRISDGNLQPILMRLFDAYKSLGRKFGDTTPTLVCLVKVLGIINNHAAAVASGGDGRHKAAATWDLEVIIHRADGVEMGIQVLYHHPRVAAGSNGIQGIAEIQRPVRGADVDTFLRREVHTVELISMHVVQHIQITQLAVAVVIFV